jgi:hypothetical protein
VSSYPSHRLLSAHSTPSLELYEFVGSCWANVPKLAITEAGFPEGAIEWVSINLAEVSPHLRRFHASSPLA